MSLTTPVSQLGFRSMRRETMEWLQVDWKRIHFRRCNGLYGCIHAFESVQSTPEAVSQHLSSVTFSQSSCLVFSRAVLARTCQARLDASCHFSAVTAMLVARWPASVGFRFVEIRPEFIFCVSNTFWPMYWLRRRFRID